MIRFIYWFLVLVEVCLLLGALVLFIVTDSRTIKYIAKTSFDSYGLSYESIEGNLFDGLEVKQLSYKNKTLFSSALIHWNPLTLFYDKVSITKLNAEGIELENIMTMLSEFQTEKLESSESLSYDFVVNNTHLDINPYVYEGVKFSSFVLETGKIKISKALNINASKFYLKFDSDIVNAKMYAQIKNSQLLVDKLELKNISAEDIRVLTNRLEKKYEKENDKEDDTQVTLLKEIKIKHILGTMKAVNYDDLQIKEATLHLYDGVIEAGNNFNYQVNKVDFQGKTNFGKLNYKGYIKNSTIYAKGDITLDKKLFSQYDLALNFEALKKLPSKLRLDHDAVWIDIDHKVKKLLKVKNSFNLDVNKAKHQLHYNYDEDILSIDSELSGQMTYANAFELSNRVLIDEKGFSYAGKASLVDSRALPSMVTEYLLPSIQGDFKGDSKDFEVLLKSNFFNGIFKMKEYERGELEFKSKTNNLVLNKIVPNIPEVFKNELVGLEGKGLFDFNNFKKSKVNLNLLSNTMNIEAQMKLFKPYKIDFLTEIKNDMLLRKVDDKINFSKLQNLKGSLAFFSNRYFLQAWNEQLKFELDYDLLNDSLNKGTIKIGNEAFSFQKNHKSEFTLNTRITNIQDFLKKIRAFYKIDLPNIEGSADLAIKQVSKDNLSISLKSPHLKYASADKTTNIYNLETEFIIDNSQHLNLLIKNYKFRIDENDYLNVFYSNNDSILNFKNEVLSIEKLWINDKVLLTGKHNFKKREGDFKLKSDNYGFNNKDLSLQLNLDLDAKVVNERVNIFGDVNILGGTIRYEVAGTDIVEDADIVIMEDIIKAKESPFKNLKLYIKINSKKPLKYVAENINLEFFNQLSIVKNFEQKMLITGTSTISDGYYQLEDKRFILDKSHLYFAGDLKKPLLDIKASYTKDEYNVHVFIAGTTDAPIVNFNAEPYLTQQEILSLILFDGTGSSSGKGAEAYTLLGGSFAKGLIKSLGIDVDHLLLGKDREEELSLEVGRKISKDISVLYLHKDGLDGVKVKVEHSKSFETDIIIQPPNTSSIEFLYKQDR